MAKFKFRMQTLLKIREMELENRRMELAEAVQADRVLEARLEEVAQQLVDLTAANRQAMVGSINVDTILNNRRHEALLLGHRQELGEQRKLVQAEIERRKQRLVEANRQVKIMEKLREKQHERFREEERQVHIREMDEIAGVRTVRQKTTT